MPLPRVEITGRVENVALRVTGKGSSVTNFRVAAHRLRRRGDKWQETDHISLNCVCWDKLAEHVSDALSEGTEVTVVGELRQDDYDGQPRYEVTAKAVSLALPLKAQRERPVEDETDPWTTHPPVDPWAADTTNPSD